MYAGDADGVAGHFSADAEYTDVASPPDDVARGPAMIAARLRLALEGVQLADRDRRTCAEGDLVMTEHVELWEWRTGERAELPIASVHEFRDGSLIRWTDYWDLQTLLGAAPGWWLEHVSAGYQ